LSRSSKKLKRTAKTIRECIFALKQFSFLTDINKVIILETYRNYKINYNTSKKMNNITETGELIKTLNGNFIGTITIENFNTLTKYPTMTHSFIPLDDMRSLPPHDGTLWWYRGVIYIYNTRQDWLDRKTIRADKLVTNIDQLKKL
jgi:hypothetical protein